MSAMHSSDSEDFESADEGHEIPDKKERKKRISSSNYSDNPLETDNKASGRQTSAIVDQKLVENTKSTDGWDDFDIEESDTKPPNKSETKVSTTTKHTEISKKQESGWDDFDIEDSEIKPPNKIDTKVSTTTKHAEISKNQESGTDGLDNRDSNIKPSKQSDTEVSLSTTTKQVEFSKNQESGWDDFDIEESETVTTNKKSEIKQLSIKSTKDNRSQDTGWDDFGDWGQDDGKKLQEVPKSQTVQPDPDIKAVTDKLAAASTGGWGWGWSVDSLLSTATAGITNITSQVSQGITTVLETGIGAPEPEELARKSREQQIARSETAGPEDKSLGKEVEDSKGSGEGAFAFGGLFSGVTKFVETTGTKVISGGLDTLETIGKKTMEVLQDGDPGLAKKRALLGLSASDKPVLSQLLREAKAQADEEDKVREEKREAKEVHYENLFDDYEGLVHLEALEMLSKQVSMRIEERLRSVDPSKRQDIKETLQQVAELCEMPEEDEDEPSSEETSKADAFHERLQTATQDLGLKLQFQSLVKQYTDIIDWLSNPEPTTEKAVYKKAVSNLAQSTALTVELYHKAGEMLLVNARRSTADEADALTQMTVVLTKHISELATLFTEKLNAIPTENKEQVNHYITNIFLEAGNSSTYVQNAFQLALPILQIGAV